MNKRKKKECLLGVGDKQILTLKDQKKNTKIEEKGWSVLVRVWPNGCA